MSVRTSLVFVNSFLVAEQRERVTRRISLTYALAAKTLEYKGWSCRWYREICWSRLLLSYRLLASWHEFSSAPDMSFFTAGHLCRNTCCSSNSIIHFNETIFRKHVCRISFHPISSCAITRDLELRKRCAWNKHPRDFPVSRNEIVNCRSRTRVS